MINFIIIIAVLIIMTLLILFRPFYGKLRQKHTKRHHINIAIYQDVLKKLEQERTAGILNEKAYHEALQEARLRLLQEVPEEDANLAIPSAKNEPIATILLISVILPLLSIWLYGQLGSWQWRSASSALPSTSTATVDQKHDTDEETRRVVAKFATQLEQQPNDPKGWALLGRSYKFLQRLEEAEQAFEKAGSYLNNDAQLLAEYADVVVINANGRFVDKALTLIKKAIQVDPNNMMALWLAGTAAYYQQDTQHAIVHWKKLLTLLPPGSEDAQSIRNSILELGGSLESTTASTPSDFAQSSTQDTTQETSIQGTIRIDPQLQANITKTDTILIIARPPNRRMPVAVIREPLAGFSLAFTLDDSRSMRPNMKLSAFPEVKIEARISKSGMAMPEAGDLISSPQIVKLGTKGVILKIDQVRQ